MLQERLVKKSEFGIAHVSHVDVADCGPERLSRHWGDLHVAHRLPPRLSKACLGAKATPSGDDYEQLSITGALVPTTKCTWSPG